MRATVAKRLRRQASAGAAELPARTGLAWRVMRRIRMVDAEGEAKLGADGKEIIVEHMTARHEGFTRIYRDLKRAYRHG